MTELISLISVILMAVLLLREHAAHRRTAARLAKFGVKPRGKGGKFLKGKGL